MPEPSRPSAFLGLMLPAADGAERAATTDLLANVVACVLDEALLRRIGEFQWQDSFVVAPPTYDAAVPVNRWERAACHFWDTLFTGQVYIGPTDRGRLIYLLGDVFKAAERCRAGDICMMMGHSLWQRVLQALSAPSGEAAS